VLIDVLSLYISYVCECVDYCLDISSYYCEHSTSAIVNLKLQGDRVMAILNSLITAVTQQQKLHLYGSEYYISCPNLMCDKNSSVTNDPVHKISQSIIIVTTVTTTVLLVAIFFITCIIVVKWKKKSKIKYPPPETISNEGEQSDI